MPATQSDETKDALSDHAYEQIRRMVMEGVLPRTRRISETKLGNELGISRTPVREAIQRLAREGLLVQRPSSGTYIVQPKRREVQEIYEVRLALETMAVSKAARLMTDKQIAKLNQCVEKMKQAITAFRKTRQDVITGNLLSRYHAADQTFHNLILTSANNRFAHSIVTQGHVKQFIFGQQSHHRNLHHLAWMWLKHAQLARAITRRDPSDARRCMNRLIKTSMHDALKQVSQDD